MIFVIGNSNFISINSNKAVLHINVQSGSIVSFSKNNIILKTLNSNQAMPNVDGKTADYYYSINSNDYGEWTVTATLGENSTTENVIVDSNKQYDIELTYLLYLYKYGVSNTEWTRKDYYCSVNFGTDRMTFTQSDSGGHTALYTTNRISLEKRTKICVDGKNHGNYISNFGLTDSIGNWNPPYKIFTRYSNRDNIRYIQYLDISEYTHGSYYVAINGASGDEIFQIWLE